MKLRAWLKRQGVGSKAALPDGAGGPLPLLARIVADRDNTRACGGGTTRWRDPLLVGVQAPTKKRD